MLQGPKYLVLKPILTEKPGSGGKSSLQWFLRYASRDPVGFPIPDTTEL